LTCFCALLFVVDSLTLDLNDAGGKRKEKSGTELQEGYGKLFILMGTKTLMSNVTSFLLRSVHPNESRPFDMSIEADLNQWGEV